MKRQFVIECDTEMSTVFVDEVTKDFENGTVNYHKEAGGKPLLFGFLGPKFYGQLDALLITAEKIADAKEIEIEPAEATCTPEN
jgi:hypothetical protein